MPLTKSFIAAAPVYAVLPAIDAARARDFYDRLLGLETQEVGGQPGYFLVFAGQGTRFLVYETEAHGAASTSASFMVDDIDTAVRDLQARGVTFEEYDMPGMKTVDGIADLGPMGRSAWFRDTEGNVLVIAQM